MQEILKLLIGIIILVLGIPVGNLLARYTQEELKEGQKWFKCLILLSLIVGGAGLIIGNDALMFSLFFIAVVTSRSLKK